MSSEATTQSATIRAMMDHAQADQATIAEQARTIARLERQLADTLCPVKGPLINKITSKQLSNPTHQLHLSVYSVTMGLGPIINFEVAA